MLANYCSVNYLLIGGNSKGKFYMSVRSAYVKFRMSVRMSWKL